MKMPPNVRTYIPPEGGWKQNTMYVVDVSFRPTNPIHRAMFYTGFLQDGIPSGYNQLWSPTWDNELHKYSDMWYIQVVREVPGFKR